MLDLRYYQRESLDALYAHFKDGGQNGLIVLPTGAGKALVIAALITEIMGWYPEKRIAVVTHSRELVAQNHAELKAYWPAAPAGIYSAGLGRKDTRSKILFCGIASVHNKTRLLGAFDFVIVDECHLIPRNRDTFYGRFLRDQAGARLIGLTATPFRLDSGRLNTGEDAMFEAVVYDANVRDLIEKGYLSPLISKATITKLDTNGVAKRGGDYVPGQLAEAVDQEEITRAAVAEVVERGRDRRAWLAFCCSVEHAIHVRDEIRSHGITAETVTGETPSGERDRIIRDFKAGRIRCLTSMAVLTTGFNVPAVDMLALLRPTKSAGLYIQMVGRAMRKAVGKDNALVLDFAGCVREHGPIDCVQIREPGAKAGIAPTKECEHCHSYMPISAMVCEDCGSEFPLIERGPREIKIEREADSTSLILSTEPPTELRVKSWRFRVHEKKNELGDVSRTLRVDFFCGLTNPSIWLCPEHRGAMRHKAERWWKMAGGDVMPSTAAECVALADTLERPTSIKTRPNGKYTDVVGYEFAPVLQLEAAE
ncbi:DEAD/DEAH box helicase [Methylobacterium sp. WL19]|nr:DEAD/DEAH box helicase [Methylobacterium sp. WL19]